MKRVLSALLLCLPAGSARVGASPGWRGARAKAQAARTEVRTLRERQQALRGELNGLAEPHRHAEGGAPGQAHLGRGAGSGAASARRS